MYVCPKPYKYKVFGVPVHMAYANLALSLLKHFVGCSSILKQIGVVKKKARDTKANGGEAKPATTLEFASHLLAS